MKNRAELDETSLLRLGGFAALDYVGALWITYLSKWAEMTTLESLNWLLSFPRNLGFFNTGVLLSLAYISAVIGNFLHREKVSSIKP